MRYLVIIMRLKVKNREKWKLTKSQNYKILDKQIKIARYTPGI